MARVGAAIAEVIHSLWSACAKAADGCWSCADAAVMKKTLLAIKPKALPNKPQALPNKPQAPPKASVRLCFMGFPASENRWQEGR
jgi:hypothetical protein